MAYVVGQKYYFGGGDEGGSATYAGEYNGQPVWSDDWGRLHTGDPLSGPEVVRSGSGFAPMPKGSAYGDQGIIDYWAANPAPAGSSSIPGTPGYAPSPTRSLSLVPGGNQELNIPYGGSQPATTGPTPSSPFPGMVYDPDKGTYVTDLDPNKSIPWIPPGGSVVQPPPVPGGMIGADDYGGGDPYEAFKAQFQKEYGRPITQEEMNSNQVLVDQLGISNELMTLLPVERVIGFDAKRLALLDNNVLGALINWDPRIVGNFGVDRLATFDNGFIQSVIAPYLAQVNPVAAQELATATGGVVGGSPPPTQMPGPRSQAPGVPPPTYPTPSAPGGAPAPIGTPGQTGGPAPSYPSGPLTSRYQAPTVQGGADPLGIFTNTINQTPWDAPSFGQPDVGSRDRWSLFGGGDVEEPFPYDTFNPGQPPPTGGGDGGAGVPKIGDSYPVSGGGRVVVKGFDRDGNPITEYVPDRDPRSGGQPSTSVMIGAPLLQDKTQAQIERLYQQIEQAQQNAALAQRKQDFAEQKYYEQQAAALQQQASQLALTAELGYADSRRKDIGTQLGIEGQEFGQQRSIYQDRADAAWKAAQIALSQGNQAEAKRQFDLSYKLQELATQENLTQGAFNRNMATKQFEMQQRRDPASFLDKVFAARGQAAPTGQPGAAGGAPAPLGSQAQPFMPRSIVNDQAIGGPVADDGMSYLGGSKDFQEFSPKTVNFGGKTYTHGDFNVPGSAPSAYPAPLSAGDILNSEFTPPGIRQVFGGGGRLGSTASAPTAFSAPTAGGSSFSPVSAQDWGDLSAPERQATLAAVQATGVDPDEYLKRSRQLTTGSFGGSTYAAPVR